MKLTYFIMSLGLISSILAADNANELDQKSSPKTLWKIEISPQPFRSYTGLEKISDFVRLTTPNTENHLISLSIQRSQDTYRNMEQGPPYIEIDVELNKKHIHNFCETCQIVLSHFRDQGCKQKKINFHTLKHSTKSLLTGKSTLTPEKLFAELLKNNFMTNAELDVIFQSYPDIQSSFQKDALLSPQSIYTERVKRVVDKLEAKTQDYYQKTTEYYERHPDVEVENEDQKLSEFVTGEILNSMIDSYFPPIRDEIIGEYIKAFSEAPLLSNYTILPLALELKHITPEVGNIILEKMICGDNESLPQEKKSILLSKLIPLLTDDTCKKKLELLYKGMVLPKGTSHVAIHQKSLGVDFSKINTPHDMVLASLSATQIESKKRQREDEGDMPEAKRRKLNLDD